jgi:uncharacterized phage protein (TIGR01671 family)
MRTIKDYRFRIWDPEEQCYDRFTFASLGDLIDWGASQRRTDNGNGQVDIQERDLEGLPIEQWTGMLDKNGVEIFEGDILLQLDNRDVEGWHFAVGDITTYIPLYPINCNGKRFNMEIALGGSGRLRGWTGGNEPFYKVVGNIHENPELFAAQ